MEWTKLIMQDLRDDDGPVSLKMLYLLTMYGTPYGLSAILASKLPDSWFEEIDLNIRGEKYVMESIANWLEEWDHDPDQFH